MKQHELTVLSAGHTFLEAPRWHDGKLWASDFFSQQVITVGPEGTATGVAKVDGGPSGLGFLPDGTPLVVSQAERAVYKILPAGGLERYADFSSVAAGLGNDMHVAPTGHAYVGNFGYALGEEDPRTTRLAHIRPGGQVEAVPADLLFPNGSVRTPEGILLVAETFAHRISAFDIADDGALTDHRIWTQLDDTLHPDGITLDSDGGVWFGNALTRTDESGFYRVTEDGEITDKIPVPDAWAVALTFGGTDLDTLYLMCNATTLEEFHAGQSTAYVATARVGRRGVPGSM